MPPKFSPPRRLTKAEIDDIVSVIPPVRAASKAVAEDNLAQIKRATRLQLGEISIVPEQIPKLKVLIYNRAARADVQPGDTVGLQAAEAIGHPISQGVLNSFHSSGSADVGGMGLQKFTELLNLSPNRRFPKTNIHFRNANVSFRDATAIARAFEAPTVRSLLTDPVLGITFHRRKRDEPLPSFYAGFEAYMLAVTQGAYAAPWISTEDSVAFVRLTMSPVRLTETRVSLDDVARTLEETGGATCVYSATTDGIVDIYAKQSVLEGTIEVEQEAQRARAQKAPKRGAKQGVDTGRVYGMPMGPVAAAAAQEAKAHRDEARGAAERDAPMIDQTITSVSRSVIVKKDIPVQFLQTAVVPRITGDTFVVASSVAQRSLAAMVPPGRVVPQLASVLSLFRNTTVVQTKTTEIARGAVRVSDNSWRVWLDRSKQIEFGVPIEKVVGLFQVAFPDATSEFDSVDFAIDITWPSSQSEDPLEDINQRYGKDNSAFKDATRAEIADATRRKTPLKAVPRTELQTACEYIHVLGTHNFIPTLKRLLIHPAINNRTTTTNNFHEIAKVRGIEVARTKIIMEFYSAILESGSSNINPIHVKLVGDVMTGLGVLTPFNARGSVRQRLGAYSESSFEQALAAFQRSAINGTPEPVAATSTSILTGSLISYGTGAFRLVAEGGYQPPPYMNADEAIDDVAPQDPTPPVVAPMTHQVTDTGVAGAVAVAVSTQDVPAEPYPRPQPGTFGSMVFPPRDPDAVLGTLSTRDFLKLAVLNGAARPMHAQT